MPETAIDENNRPETREYKVGAAGQVAAMKAETKATRVQFTLETETHVLSDRIMEALGGQRGPLAARLTCKDEQGRLRYQA